MTSKELRVGNFVCTKSTIIEIMPMDIVAIHQCEQANAKIDYWGIEISEEWLKKLGFRYWQHWKLWRVASLYDRVSVIKSEERGLFYVRRFGRITYVHELQNLYFFMNRKELIYHI